MKISAVLRPCGCRLREHLPECRSTRFSGTILAVESAAEFRSRAINFTVMSEQCRAEGLDARGISSSRDEGIFALFFKNLTNGGRAGKAAHGLSRSA